MKFLLLAVMAISFVAEARNCTRGSYSALERQFDFLRQEWEHNLVRERRACKWDAQSRSVSELCRDFSNRLKNSNQVIERWRRLQRDYRELADDAGAGEIDCTRRGQRDNAWLFFDISDHSWDAIRTLNKNIEITSQCNKNIRSILDRHCD